jgi:hypothetical protein
MDWKNLGIQKYWAPTAAVSKEMKRMKLEAAAESGQYIWSEKFDGNFLRGIVTPEYNVLQTRGISTVTKTYGEVQDKVLFWDDVCKAFTHGDTVILGEGYIPGGVDATVGSVLRCLTPKALARQKEQPVEWRIFDVLALDGESFLDKPIEERVLYIDKVVARINNPLVRSVKFYEMDENFFDNVAEIFERGGEGAVCYKKGVLYTPGKRSSAWTTIKVKQEITSEIDAIITDVVQGEKLYHGDDIGHWPLWENARTGELVQGEYFGEYRMGGTYTPVTKNYWNKWPAAIQVGVYNKEGIIIPLCKVSGLTEEFKTALRDNPKEWIGTPVTLTGMMVSERRANSEGEGISIRHPILRSLRKDDLDPKDCTLEKILG